jgi:hypothetical protein
MMNGWRFAECRGLRQPVTRLQASTRRRDQVIARPKEKTTLHVFSSSPLFFRPHTRYSADKHVKLLVVSLLDTPYSLMPKYSISTASLLG